MGSQRVRRDRATEPIQTAVPQGKLLDFCVLQFSRLRSGSAGRSSVLRGEGRVMVMLMAVMTVMTPLPSSLLPELYQKHRWDCVILLLNSLQMAPYCLKNVQTP